MQSSPFPPPRYSFLLLLLLPLLSSGCLTTQPDDVLAVTSTTTTTTTTTCLGACGICCAAGTNYVCPSGWALFVDPTSNCGYCYKIANVFLPWTAGRAACMALYPCADLATILTQAEQEFLLTTFNGNTLWIGLSTDNAVAGTTDNWMWLNGDCYSWTGWEQRPAFNGAGCAELDCTAVGGTGWFSFVESTCVTTVGQSLCKLPATIV